jgi:hypothetical protein
VGAVGRRLTGLAAAAVLVVPGCSTGPAGLGKHACPYLRPRLIRLDNALLAGRTADVVAVDQDLALYVKTNLPAKGKAKSDRPVVAFSHALDAYVKSADTSVLDAAEGAVKHECAVQALGAVRPGSPTG